MYSMPQKSKCVPCKAGCHPWVCGILGKFQQFRLEHGVGALLEAGEQSLGVHRAAAGMQCRALSGRAPGTGSQSCSGRAALRHGAPSPAVEDIARVEEFHPTVQVSSPDSWKSISTTALQGTDKAFEKNN